MDRMRLALAGAAMLAALSLGACGGSPAAARIVRRGRSVGTTPSTVKLPNQGGTLPPGPIKPACELVSRDEVAAAVGNPVGAGIGQGRNCSWATEVDGGTSVTITAVKPPAGKPTADECDRLRLGQPREAKHENVSGVGTSAVWVVDALTTLTQGSLVACWDDSAAFVLLTGERDVAALRATAVNLAQRVRSRS